MGFVISDTKQGDSFFYPVKVPVTLDTGRKKTYTFEMKFKRMTKSDYLEVMRSDDADTTDAVARDTTVILDLADDWRYVQDDNGKDLPFNFDNLYKMLNVVPSSAMAILTAFNLAVLAGGQLEKN